MIEKIASWNVNSVRPRLGQLVEWLRQENPCVVLLQEIKCVDEAFPYELIEELGYNIAVNGQRTYNGVAILSKFPLEDIQKGLPTLPDDPQARYLEAFTGGMRVASVYVPNGQSVGSEKYIYKLDFLTKLQAHCAALAHLNENTIIAGDFNVAPTDLDVWDPVAWENQILCSPGERAHFEDLLRTGYLDALRHLYPSQSLYTWWDYRQASFVRNRGLRIDHFLMSSALSPTLKEGGVFLNVRKEPRPSDHAPVWIAFNATPR